jgi:hypothetical protein
LRLNWKSTFPVTFLANDHILVDVRMATDWDFMANTHNINLLKLCISLTELAGSSVACEGSKVTFLWIFII